MKKLLCSLFILFIPYVLSAQGILVEGVVTDLNNDPLPGVNVVVLGSTIGTQTDFDGRYTLQTSVGKKIQFSFIGYKNVVKKVTTLKTINVVMEEDAQALEEVVVSGYGIKRQKRALGYATTSVVANQLSGKVSGVNLVTGTRPVLFDRLQIRGTSTATMSEEPLYIVDGKVLKNEALQNLMQREPYKIKKVEVLKGEQAIQRFGKRGKNGCIIILTKNGTYNPDTETYESYVENPFQLPALHPFSTFSIDVDKASYSNVRRMINNGQNLRKDAVKIEEMVNYFKYDYPQPTGKHPFAIHTELGKSPWNKDAKLLKIGLQGKTIANEQLPASNLTFLIDVSGSMRASNKLGLLKKAFGLLVNQLRAKDKVAIVVYAGAAGVVLEPTSGKNKEKILGALEQLEAGGSTAGGAGIELAYDLATKHFKKNGNNRVILATDGDFNVGDSNDKAMEDLIVEKRKTGVFLSVLGFGYGNYKDSKLEVLADKGNGNHAYIDTMQEAKKVFGQEFGGTLHTIAKDVKIQIEFNPSLVEAYRLIGYENRMLAAEDFANDAKDAGELGSGHSVTALYEIIPKGVKSNFVPEASMPKFTKEVTTDNLLAHIKFRYKKPDGETSILIEKGIEQTVQNNLSADFSFAAAVALFGQLVKTGNYTNNASLDLVLELAIKGRGEDKAGYRAEFMRLVELYPSS